MRTIRYWLLMAAVSLTALSVSLATPVVIQTLNSPQNTNTQSSLTSVDPFNVASTVASTAPASQQVMGRIPFDTIAAIFPASNAFAATPYCSPSREETVAGNKVKTNINTYVILRVPTSANSKSITEIGDLPAEVLAKVMVYTGLNGLELASNHETRDLNRTGKAAIETFVKTASAITGDQHIGFVLARFVDQPANTVSTNTLALTLAPSMVPSFTASFTFTRVTTPTSLVWNASPQLTLLNTVGVPARVFAAVADSGGG